MKKLQETVNESMVNEAHGATFNDLKPGDPLYVIEHEGDDNETYYTKYTITELNRDDDVIMVETDEEPEEVIVSKSEWGREVYEYADDDEMIYVFANLDAVKLKLDESRKKLEKLSKEILNAFK